MDDLSDLNPGDRVLMGPGPSNASPRVLRTLATPLVGHLDPEFLTIMDETQQLLRHVFGTHNAWTIPISGTGTAGMEACLVNLIEPGDPVLICVHGAFGQRMVQMAERFGADVATVEAPWGQPIDPEDVARTLESHPARLVCVVHAETSTGVLQPLEPLARLAHDHDALIMADMVTSLGGLVIDLDGWGIDAAYSGTQKGLSCPPGLAPVTFGPAAVERVKSRKQPPYSWYLDLSLLLNYWGEERTYHHTAPISMVYALREGLRLVVEEGLEAREARHRRLSQELVAGLEELGFELLVDEAYRLPMLTTVKVPAGIDDLQGRRTLLDEYQIEIGGGLGALAGKVWRIGLMGHGCNRRNIRLLLGALEQLLKSR